MSTLSANTLFHFTRNKENLISILNSCFYPKYCLEEFYFLQLLKTKWALPMVCFCDIPLSQIKNHTLKYGEYAIGLTKEWAQIKGITPILYIPKESPIIRNFKDSFRALVRNRQSGEKGSVLSSINIEFTNYLLYLAFNTKPYEGFVELNNKKSNVRFYDEREWRYTVPKEAIITGNEYIYLNKKEFEKTEDVAKRNKLNEIYGLTFEPKNINYIIVSKESEVLEVMREIRNIKGNFPYNDVELLATRILSMERISEDF